MDLIFSFVYRGDQVGVSWSAGEIGGKALWRVLEPLNYSFTSWSNGLSIFSSLRPSCEHFSQGWNVPVGDSTRLKQEYFPGAAVTNNHFSWWGNNPFSWTLCRRRKWVTLAMCCLICLRNSHFSINDLLHWPLVPTTNHHWSIGIAIILLMIQIWLSTN